MYCNILIDISLDRMEKLWMDIMSAEHVGWCLLYIQRSLKAMTAKLYLVSALSDIPDYWAITICVRRIRWCGGCRKPRADLNAYIIRRHSLSPSEADRLSCLRSILVVADDALLIISGWRRDRQFSSVWKTVFRISGTLVAPAVPAS